MYQLVIHISAISHILQPAEIVAAIVAATREIWCLDRWGVTSVCYSPCCVCGKLAVGSADPIALAL